MTTAVSNPSARMRPGVLRALLMGMVLLVQMITVVVVVTGMRADTAQQFAENARTELGLLADTVTDRAKLYLAPAENTITIGRSLMSDGLLDPTDDSRMLRFLMAQMESRQSLRGIFFGRNDGTAVMVGRNTQGLRSTVIGVREGEHTATITQHANAPPAEPSTWTDPRSVYDPRLRPWFDAARASESVIWTGVYPFPGSLIPGIAAAIAVRDASGQLIGVLGVEVNVQELSAFISTVPNASSGSAVILDEHRHAVAFSDIWYLREHLEQGRMPSFERVADKPLQGLMGVIEGLSNPADELPGGFSRMRVDGIEHLGLVRAIELSEGKVNWLLMVQAPADEYSGGMLQLIMTKLKTLIAIILIPGVLAMFAILRLTAPVYSLHEEATTDHLTGALTRSEFEQRLSRLMDSRRENDREAKIVVMALDLDGFKAVNDQFGHGAGDAVLRTVVDRLQRHLQSSDLIGRTGGDEFIVALRLDPLVDEIETVRQIRWSVVQQPVKTQAGPQVIGITAGVATRMPGEPREQLVSRADHALVTGKTRRKNRCYVAHSLPECGPSQPAVPGLAAGLSAREIVGTSTATTVGLASAESVVSARAEVVA